MMRRALIAVFMVSVLVHAQPARSKVALPCESSLQLLSPTGTHVAIRCKDASWNLIDLKSGNTIHQLNSRNRVSAHSFSNDGKWFAAGLSDGTIELLPLNPPAPAVQWQPATGEFDQVYVLSNYVIVAAHEKPAQVWQLSASPTLKATLATDFSGLTFVASSPDGKLLATGGADTVIRIYDTTSWELRKQYRQMTVEPFAGDFTSDGKYLVVGGADNRLTLLDPLAGTEVRTLPASTDVVSEIHPLHGDRILALQWDADGKNPPYLSLWDLNSGKSTKISGHEPITGGGVVDGEPWFTTAAGSSLDIWSDKEHAGL